MGHQSSKAGFETIKTLVVRDALTGEELCRLDNVDHASTGLEVKERIKKSIKDKTKQKDFQPSSKRLLWGSTILCDHLTLGEIIACSLYNDGLNPNELSVLTRPETVQKWLQNHKQLNDNRNTINSWSSYKRRSMERSRPDLRNLLQFFEKGRLDQALHELENGGDDIRSDVECMAALMHDDGLMLQHASAELQELDFLVMTAVKQNGLVLQYASPRLQDKDVIVLAAVKQNGLALQYASSRLQDTDLIVTTAVKRNGLALQHASCRFQDAELTVSDAVKQNGFALQHASSRLQDANAIVSAAVKQNGLALQHASSRLQDDDLVAWHAVKQNGLALQLATSRLRDDHQIVKDAVMQNGWALEYASSRLQDNWSGIVYFAFRQDIRTQQYASARIQERCRM